MDGTPRRGMVSERGESAGEGKTFHIAYDPGFLWLARLTGTGPRRSTVELDAHDLRVRMGWAFQARIPRSSIVDVRRVPDEEAGARFMQLGAHTYGGGRWDVNGSRRGWVTLEIDPPASGRSGFSSTKVAELNITVTDPDGLVDALKEK